MDDDAASTQPDAASDARLQVAEDLRNRSLDGAWWPRSDDPSVEIGALLAAAPASLGRIARVAMSTTGWSAMPRRVARPNGGRMRVGWFSVVDPNVVTLVRIDGSRLRLLIVPPATPDDVAERAMTAAVDAKEKHQSPAEFLSDAGAVDIPASRRGEAGLLLGGAR